MPDPTCVPCEHFRQNVRDILTRKKWTQDTLAKELGTTPGFISQLLLGHRDPGLPLIGRLADALGVNVTQLVKKNPNVEETWA
jgi:transcriptional regulator with XRE-family HTH domain